MYFYSNFIVFSQGSNWHCGSIGLDNGLAENRQQAIIWTNDGLIYWHIYASLSLNELTLYMLYLLQRTYVDGLMQDCSISIANTLEILQFCTKPLNYCW